MKNKRTLKHKTIATLVTNYCKGLSMGFADLLPGISGGTVAVIAGFYDQLITSIAACAQSLTTPISPVNTYIARVLKKIPFLFLVPLGVGILCAILVGSTVLYFLFNTYSSSVYSFVFGLVLASIVIMLKHIKKKDVLQLVILVLGMCIGFFYTQVPLVSASPTQLSLFFISIIAACVMIIPGVSGSYVLLVTNHYEFVIEALHTPLQNLVTLSIVSVGVLIGILLSSIIMKALLKKAHDRIMILLVGIIIGSLNIIMLKSNVFSILGALLLTTGIVLVLGASILSSLKNKRNANSQ